MQRVKNIDYDEDDVYSDNDGETYEGDEQEFSVEDKDNFATLTPVVRAELEEVGVHVSDKQIEEALWHYYWDVSKSVTYLRNLATPQSNKTRQSAPKKEKAKSKFDKAAEKSASTDPTKHKANSSSLTQKTASLKLDPDATTPPQVKIRSKGLDVPKLWSERRAKQKPSAAFVVIGHVDHGKSTLMGRLLLDTGAVAQRDIDKYKKQAAELGKASFALAWVMDTGSEERERGVTVDIAQHHFSTKQADLTILDAPGHRDFVPNMVGGASMADFAVLVVDANQLDSGMKGQTREHILLAKAIGIAKVIVAINKLDASSPPWSEDLFRQVSSVVVKFLESAGFLADNISVVPCSGLSGENVVKISNEQAALSWVAKSHTTLLTHLESTTPPPPAMDVVQRPFRLQVSDFFRGGITNPLSIAGRIIHGHVQIGDVLTVQPSGEQAVIKGIEVSGEPQDFAVANQICTLHLADIDSQHIRVGDMMCSTSQPVPVVDSLTVNVVALETLLPQAVDLHIGRLHVPGRIVRLVAITDAKSGATVKMKPRVVTQGQHAVVKLNLDQAMPVLDQSRIVLRSGGSTIAAGVVEHVQQ